MRPGRSFGESNDSVSITASAALGFSLPSSAWKLEDIAASEQARANRNRKKFRSV